jgi:aminoglycoside phosphotransferase (APT) family kinase protein
MTLAIDRPGPVRPAEELDVARLQAYLSARWPDLAEPLVVEQFPCGYSNLTYLLRAGDREWVLRRPPFGNQVKTAHDMGREFRVLKALSRVYPPAPVPYLYCEEESVLGAPFYVMQRREGVILRQRLPPGLDLAPDTLRRLSLAFIDHLAALHSLDYRAAGLGDLGRPEGYVERQVTGWGQRYRKAQTGEVPPLERALDWLEQNRPGESGAALIHNDYKYDNLLLNPHDLAEVRAVLDWEMATVGDPLMDLGTTLGYWVETGDPESFRAIAFGPTARPGSLTRRELVEHYAQRTGRDVGGVLFYHVFGLFKIAVIVQQIYARYVRGHTRDERFARLDDMVAVLGEAAARAIEKGQL